MEEKKRSGFAATVISGLCVVVSLMLLLHICGQCYPAAQEKAKDIFAGMENGALRQAFGTLADGLENGEPVIDTLAQTAQVLFDEG